LPTSPSGGERGLLNTASVAAYDGQIGQVAYSASKARRRADAAGRARTGRQGRARDDDRRPDLRTPMLAELQSRLRQSLAASIPFPSRLAAQTEYADLACHIVTNRC